MATDGVDEEGEPAYVYLLGSRVGYEDITDFTVDSPTQFTTTSSKFYAGYKGLFNEIYPSHVFSADPVEAANELNTALREWKLADGTVDSVVGPDDLRFVGEGRAR